MIPITDRLREQFQIIVNGLTYEDERDGSRRCNDCGAQWDGEHVFICRLLPAFKAIDVIRAALVAALTPTPARTDGPMLIDYTNALPHDFRLAPTQPAHRACTRCDVPEDAAEAKWNDGKCEETASSLPAVPVPQEGETCPTCGSSQQDAHPLVGNGSDDVRICHHSWHRRSSADARAEGPTTKPHDRTAEDMAARYRDLLAGESLPQDLRAWAVISEDVLRSPMFDRLREYLAVAADVIEGLRVAPSVPPAAPGAEDATQNPPRRAGHDAADWIDRAPADIRDLNRDYHAFEDAVSDIIRGYVARAASPAPAAGSAHTLPCLRCGATSKQ